MCLGWPSCGHFIMMTHGFQNLRHFAPILERGYLYTTFDFLGPNGPIVAEKFNNYLFQKHYLNGSDWVDHEQVDTSGRANGAVKSNSKESVPHNKLLLISHMEGPNSIELCSYDFKSHWPNIPPQCSTQHTYFGKFGFKKGK